MPVHKVKGGYKWGKTGKIYPTKKQAEKQARAIYANGYEGVNEEDNKGSEMPKNMIKKNTIRLTESELKRVIVESVKRVVTERLNHFGQPIINLDGNPSLVSVMEYIRDNGGPITGKWQFTFDNGKMLICNPLSQDDDMLECALDDLPLEEWHDVLGMKRIKFYNGWIIYVLYN